MADSYRIPLNIQSQILKRLPVKSLLRCRSISKPWKSLIDSSEFIADYSVNHTRPNRLLVGYANHQRFRFDYVSIVDDDSFPQKKVFHSIPMLDKIGSYFTIIGISQGLFCLYNRSKPKTAVIWNPSIRKSIDIETPNNMLNSSYDSIIGLGLCPCTSDPKLIMITSFENWQVEVFTLSSGTWRTLSFNWSHRHMVLDSYQVDLDGFIYWSAYEIKYHGAEQHSMCNIIISFDITTEEFKQVYLPPSLQIYNNTISVRIAKLRDSLVVLENNRVGEERDYSVWVMMKRGISRPFTKRYTIRSPDACIRQVYGFRYNGKPIYEVKECDISHLGMYGVTIRSLVSSYVETLLLHDR